MKKYQWISAGFAKGISPDEAIKELESIENTYGSLTAENIVTASEKENALFHKLFLWDNEKAAHQYRLSQARTILNNIEVKIISDGAEKKISVFEIVKTETGKVYKNISDLNSDEIKEVRSNVIKALNYWKSKLSFYKEFDNIVPKMDSIITEVKAG